MRVLGSAAVQKHPLARITPPKISKFLRTACLAGQTDSTNSAGSLSVARPPTQNRDGMAAVAGDADSSRDHRQHVGMALIRRLIDMTAGSA
eukprot:SAG25_NODE_1008_length_4323_cov_5.595206_1_plen_90_part_10